MSVTRSETVVLASPWLNVEQRLDYLIMANVVKCNTCNIVVDELLAFVQNKIDVMDDETMYRICVSAFPTEVITKSKELLFSSVPAQARMIKRKNKPGKPQKDIEDLIALYKSTNPELIPVFVARDLHLLPPITFDHLDVTAILKKINALGVELSEIKATIVTQDHLKSIKKKLQCVDNRQKATIIDSPFSNGNYLNVNTKRGACLDSGPMGFSHFELPPSSAESSCADEMQQFPKPFNDAASLSPAQGQRRKSKTSPQYRDIQTNRVRTSGVAINTTLVPSSPSVQYVPSCSDTPKNRGNRKRTSLSPPNSETARKNALVTPQNSPTISCQTDVKDDTYTGSVPVPQQSKQKPVSVPESPKQNNWTLVVKKKTKTSNSRQIGKTGTANLLPEDKFKAADTMIPIFINNVHKDTSKEDIMDYIQRKTQEQVMPRLINSKDARKQHNAYKMYVHK